MSIKSLLFPPLNLPPKQELMETIEAGNSIPRIIHQTFYEHTLNDKLQANVDHLRALNPGWEYRYYNDDDVNNFIQKNYPALIWNYYERIDKRYGAARADFFRYLLMYKVGGVYLDIKSTATRPFDSVLQPDDRFILSKWHDENGEYEHIEFVYDLRHILGGEFQQWHIICAPGHPYLKAVIEQVLANIDAYDPYLHQTGKRGVLRVTGPIAYTLSILRILDEHSHRELDGRNQFGLDYNIYGSNLNHQAHFKGHYSRQNASIVHLSQFKLLMSKVYGLAQYVHDKLLRKPPSLIKTEISE